MSGIEEIKKKTKLSMDEMYDNQSVGKPESQKAGQPDNQLNRQLENKLATEEIVPSMNRTVEKKMTVEKSNKPKVKNLEIQKTESLKQDDQIVSNSNFGSQGKQETEANFKVKMTFNLSQKVHKAFNDLYAKRMIQGRMTEKSDLICEAIQCLIQREEELLKELNITDSLA